MDTDNPADIDTLESLLFELADAAPLRITLAQRANIATAFQRIRERLKDPCVHESAIVQNALDAQGDAETEMMWLQAELDTVAIYLDAVLRDGEGPWDALKWEQRARCEYVGDALNPCGRVIREGDRCRTHRKMEEAASRVPEVIDAVEPDDGLSPAPWVAAIAGDLEDPAGSVSLTLRDGRRCVFFLPTPADATFVANARNRLAKHRP